MVLAFLVGLIIFTKKFTEYSCKIFNFCYDSKKSNIAKR